MTGNARRLRVGIFAGGRSAEHEVSIASAESVLRSIDRDRFEPYLVYIDPDGRWRLPSGPAEELGEASLARLVGAETVDEHAIRLREHEASSHSLASVSTDGLAPRQAVRSLAQIIDVAFLAVHGPFGEDGTLQG
ncbi:MAG: D-alanine--D-alanine ligase A, partial [Candidatus Limnocylindria bacterium]